MESCPARQLYIQPTEWSQRKDWRELRLREIWSQIWLVKDNGNIFSAVSSMKNQGSIPEIQREAFSYWKSIKEPMS